jgi:hypothetical protein
VGVGQHLAFSVMRQHDLALQHLEPGQALRRHRQAGLTAGRQRQPVEQNASSRHPRIGKQVLADSPAFRRFGGDLAFVENCGHGTPLGT